MQRTRASSMLVRVILCHPEGLVWRRLRVPSTMTLADFDEMLCLAFELSGGTIPRQMKAGRKTYEAPMSSFGAATGIDHATVTIGEVARKGSRLLWRYDWVSECWEYDVDVEDTRADPRTELMTPCFIDGGGTVPTFYNHLARSTYASCRVDAAIRARFA